MFRLATTAVVSLLAVLACSLALAARVFPQNSFQVKINAVADNAIVANDRALPLAPGVLVYTTINTTIVKSAMPAGVYARVQLDLNGDVRRIWLLAPDEIVYKPWWLFWRSDDIKEQANSVVPAEQ